MTVVQCKVPRSKLRKVNFKNNPQLRLGALRDMANCCQSSCHVPYSPDPDAFPQTQNRRNPRKNSVKLTSPKPQLSLMRDRDKRFGIMLPTASGPPTPPSSSSSSQDQDYDDDNTNDTIEENDKTFRSSESALAHKEEKTNGHITTNNCPMTQLLKYLRKSAHFSSSSRFPFLSPPSSCYFRSKCPSHYSLSSPSNPHLHRYHNNSNNTNSQTKTSANTKFPLFLKEMEMTGERPSSYKPKRMRKAKNFVSSLILFLLVWLGMLSQIIHSSSASPIKSAIGPSSSSASSPSQKQTMVINKQFTSLEGEDENNGMDNFGGYHPNTVVTNNSLMEEDDDETRLMKSNEKISDSSSDSSSTSANDDSNVPDVRGVPGGQTLMNTPLALKLQTQSLIVPQSSSVSSISSSSSSSREHQHGRKGSVLQVTNDLSLGGGFDDEDEDGDSQSSGSSTDNNSFLHGNNDYENDGRKDSHHNSSRERDSSGLCRFYAWTLNEDGGTTTETDMESTDLPKHTPAGKYPIGAFCNGTRNLTFTLEQQIPESLASLLISLRIEDSSISILNLSLFHRFTRLAHLSVTYSNVSHVTGEAPVTLLALNISFNVVKRIDSTVFLGFGNPDDDNDNDDPFNNEGLSDSSNYDNVEERDNDLKDNTSIELDGRGNMSVKKTGSNISSRYGPHQSSRNKSEYFPFKTKSPSHSKLPSTSTRPLSEKWSSVANTTPITMAKIVINNRGSRSAQGAHAAPFTGESESRPHDLRRRQHHPRNRKAEAITVAGNTPNESNDDELAHHKEVNNGLVAPIKGAKGEDNDREIKMGEEISNRGDKDKGESARPGTVADAEDGDDDCRNNNNSLCESELPRSPSAIGDGTGAGNEGAGQAHIKRESYPLGRQDEQVRRGDYIPLENALSTKSSADIGDDDGSGRSYNEDEIKVEGGSPSSSSTSAFLMKEKVGRGKRNLGGGGDGGMLALEDVDLSHNKISEVPRALLELKSLKSLRLSGNQLKCDFVWEKLADWYMNSEDPNILKDGDDTFCGVVDDVRVFQFTVLGVLKAKKDVVETCSTVDKAICPDCGLYSLNKQPGEGYNLSHQSPRGNVAIALKLDCSNRSLTDLPPVPPQTWQLNVSGNAIKDLSSLKDSMYKNLLILDADSNEISTLEGLTGTPFLDKYNYLSLQNNQFSMIPSNILSSLKSMRGQGVTFLGANFIECDCEVVKEIKPLLLENSKQIKDLKEIYCKDMKSPSGESYVALKNLQYTDLCYLDTAETNEMYLYLVIFIELLLIFVIVAKVWHDQRTFRRTGILPWCSAKMPRLPCDAMLESVKEPPHFNRSSSTNVRSFACDQPTAQSISSHVQLREVRSNSGQSEKSSQISQLSSFPSSSRTSSV